jgi:single-stranded-DNA-specific exonuclease
VTDERAGAADDGGAAAPALETTPQLRLCDAQAAAALGSELGIGATVAQLLLHRGLSGEKARDWLDPKLAGLSAPDGMRGRDAAADRIASAIARGERITLYGDYDVDGTTSTALLAGVIEALGGEVTAIAASRFEGYGLGEQALARVKETRPALLVTCDCGSTDHPRIEEARRAGIETIVVDHHRVPDEPLPAVAFLNPHQPGCGFTYKGLCSAGLAFSVAAALRRVRKSELDLRPFLDLVALGTVADVMPLDGDNRRLVRAGLMRLGSGDARPGIVALRERAGVRPGTRVGGADIGFRLAPRLNAAGRLGDASLTLQLLRARSIDEARSIAARIELINDERKELQRRITEEAADRVRARRADPGGGIVVADAGWHRGVVGIVAARVVELFEAPSIVLAIEGETAHGSARTTPGFPLFDAIAACRPLLTRFGGHQAAAGVTLPAARIAEFERAFDAECRRLRAEGHGGRIDRAIDVVLDGVRFGVPTATELALLEPTGHGNREPRFLLEDARVEDASSVGDGHLKLVLRVGETRLGAFGYDMASELSRVGAKVSVIGGLRPDTYRGGENVELKIERVV